ncbi:MAG: hypothetical protein K2Q12_06230 [Rickettsiales bacterium]|nr:hypothetical protein [Rickettsiales bacterium]
MAIPPPSLSASGVLKGAANGATGTVEGAVQKRLPKELEGEHLSRVAAAVIGDTRGALRNSTTAGAAQVAADVETMVQSEAPSFWQRVFGRAEGGAWNVVNLEFYPMIAAGALGGVVKAFDWVRSKAPWLGASSEVKPGLLTKTSQWLNLPARFMGTTTLGDLASPSTVAGNAKTVFSQRKLSDKVLAEMQEAAAEEAAAKGLAAKAEPAMGKAMAFATKRTKKLGEIVQDRVNGLNSVGNPLGRLENWRTGRASGMLTEKAVNAVAEAEKILLENKLHLPEPHFNDVSQALAALKPQLGTGLSALGTKTLTKNMSAVKDTLSSLRAHVGSFETPPKELASTVAMLERQAANVAKQVEKSSGLLAKAGGWKSIGKAIENLPKAISRMPVSQGLMGAAFLAMGASAIAKTLSERHHDAQGLNRLSQDLKALPASALADELRGSMAHAGGQSGRRLTVKGSIDAAGAVLSMKMLKGGGMRAMLPLMAVQMGGGALADVLTPRSTLPMLYHNIATAHEQGQRLTAQHYGTLLGMMLPKHLERVGAENSVLYGVTQQYEAEQLAPKQMLNEIASGRFDERAASLKQQKAAAAAAAKAQHTSVPVTAPSASTASAAPASAAPREVIGKHTQAVAAQAPSPKISPSAQSTPVAASAQAAPSATVAAMAHEGRIGQTNAQMVGG